MLNVKRNDLYKAFHNHAMLFRKYTKESPNHSAGQSTGSIRMVLFYAVECGLKNLYMKGKSLGKIKEIDNHHPLRSHNLNDLLKKLKFAITLPKAEGKDKSQIEHHELHQAWRYGKELDETKEDACVKQLERILYILENDPSKGVKRG